MQRWLICVVAMVAISGCSSDSDTVAAPGQCPSLDGAWTITSHCSAGQVGTKATLHQSGCTIQSVEEWQGWSGSVNSVGAVAMSGPGGGGSTMTCTGNLKEAKLVMSCNPACDVELSR